MFGQDEKPHNSIGDAQPLKIIGMNEKSANSECQQFLVCVEKVWWKINAMNKTFFVVTFIAVLYVGTQPNQ